MLLVGSCLGWSGIQEPRSHPWLRDPSIDYMGGGTLNAHQIRICLPQGTAFFTDSQIGLVTLEMTPIVVKLLSSSHCQDFFPHQHPLHQHWLGGSRSMGYGRDTEGSLGLKPPFLVAT